MTNEAQIGSARASYVDACQHLLAVELALTEFRSLVQDFSRPLKTMLACEDNAVQAGLPDLSGALSNQIAVANETLSKINAGTAAARRLLEACQASLKTVDGSPEKVEEINGFCDAVLRGVVVVERAVVAVGCNLEAQANGIMELTVRAELRPEVLRIASELLNRAAR